MASNDFRLPSLKDLNFPYRLHDQPPKRSRVLRPAFPPHYAPYPQHPFPPDLQPQASSLSPYPPVAPWPPAPVAPQPHPLPASIAPLPSPPLADPLMLQVVKHCTSLSSFAKNCAHFQSSLPHAQPSPADLSEMSRLAVQVVHMLEDWKRSNVADPDRIKIDDSPFIAPDDSRPPKRPWEDAVTDVPQDSAEGSTEYNHNAAAEKAQQSTAEQDMELIRTKRASSAAGGSGNTGQPKSKYRKRSRATPPGKCHSCNIRETPEWRRGPDGARTLCNACGLHYAKLMRKKEKNGSGHAEQISMEDLRASARSGDPDKPRSKASRAPLSNDSDSSALQLQEQQQQEHPQHPPPQQPQHHHHHQQQQPPPPPPPQQQQQQHHQGSFQIMNLAPDPNATCAVAEASHVQGNPGPMTVWPTPTIPHPAAGRYAPEPFQHQSFLRSQHVVIPQASPR